MAYIFSGERFVCSVRVARRVCRIQRHVSTHKCMQTAVIVTVASLRLASPGAVTGGVTPFYLKKVMTFLVVLPHYTFTIDTLSTFSGDRLAGFLVNSATKNYIFIRLSPP